MNVTIDILVFRRSPKEKRAKMNQIIETAGLKNVNNVYYQLSVAEIIEHALRNNEGQLSEKGALVTRTGAYTGRSPNDRYIVDTPDVHNNINWGKINKSISEEKFNIVYEKMIKYFEGKNTYVFDGYIGADPKYRYSSRFITELASQNLFCNCVFRKASGEQLNDFKPDWTVISASHLSLNPKELDINSEAAVLLNFEKKMILVVATQYAGEIKKSIFTVMNYVYPGDNVFPMHCSCNVGEDGASALFFGLSGTGKTTLSADPNRYLIGDDEHGWSDDGIFNFENGCYAKTIKLSRENEPQIWDSIKFGSLAENVVMDPETRVLDFDDGSITENTRASYPVDFIPNALTEGVTNHPKAIVFLTADAFGVMPPVSKLNKEQAQYHFISGYTSKLAGTERGITEPQAAFSTCFGAPFMPLQSYKYAEMLTRKLEEHDTNVYIINTGWSGGPYGVGERISIPYTRAMVDAVLSGEIEKAEFWVHPVFNVMVPKSCPGVPSEVLDPKSTWHDKAKYDEQAARLAEMFVENFKKFQNVDHLVKQGPQVPVNS
jgi:phosphoenolpyruvate carboxykinase (ATP)